MQHKKQFNNYKIKQLSLELIKLGEFLSFSLNLSELYDNLEQNIKAYRFFIKKYIKPYMKFELYFEFSTIGRLHMHGVVVFESNINIIKWFNNINIIKTISSYEMDTISDMQKWMIYCRKQQEIINSESMLNKVTHLDIKNEEPVHLRDIFIESLIMEEEGNKNEMK